MQNGLVRLLRPRQSLKLALSRSLATVVRPDLFAPSTTTVSTSSPSSSSQRVTLPAFPELYDPEYLDKILPPPDVAQASVRTSSTVTASLNPFLDAVSDIDNSMLTANRALAFATSGSACLDVFSGLNSWTDFALYESMLSKSWAEDPLATLRLIWHLRSIHEGQSANEAFYRAFGWLYVHHPRTAILNLPLLVDPVIERPRKKKEGEDAAVEQDPATVRRASHGYYKDLLNILVLATNHELTPASRFLSLHVPRDPSRALTGRRERRYLPAETHDARVQAARERDQQISNAAREKRERVRAERATRLEYLLASGHYPKYKALYVAVARIFADALSHDLGSLRKIAEEGTSDKERIRLSYLLGPAAKWAPTPGGSHDMHTNISTAVAELLYRAGQLVDTASVPLSSPLTQHDAHRVRSMYSRWALTPLRRFAQVTERFMSSKQWHEIRYSRVPSKCMALNAKSFQKHDEARFGAYLRDVAGGAAVISGATLLPHELLVALGDCWTVTDKRVIEAQWDAMVQNVRDAGTLDNCLAVCDVSGSMGYFAPPNFDFSPSSALAARKRRRQRLAAREQPDAIYPALALSIVLAQTAREPWRNCFITFSQNPQMQRIDPGKGLATMAEEMSELAWGMNTDYKAVFTRLILPAALKHQLKPEEMIKRLFVFSDMEFDNSRHFAKEAWSKEHELIKAQFEAAGYAMPEIVYWNLQGASVPRPVDKTVEGTALVTGFSPNMLKMFMAGEDFTQAAEDVAPDAVQPAVASASATPRVKKPRMDPMLVMQAALARPSFSGLRVAD